MDIYLPLSGNLEVPLSTSELSETAVTMDASRVSRQDYHPAPALDLMDFLGSHEMAPHLAPFMKSDHKVVIDYGCGPDARLGILAMNYLKL